MMHRVFEDGVMTAEVSDVAALWRDDLVSEAGRRRMLVVYWCLSDLIAFLPCVTYLLCVALLHCISLLVGHPC